VNTKRMSIDKLSEEFPRLLKVMYSPSRELDKAITAICKAVTKEAEKGLKDKDMDEFIANVNRISLQVIRQITGRMHEYEKFAIKSYRKTTIRFSNYD
jgi:hypothetical protein